MDFLMDWDKFSILAASRVNKKVLMTVLESINNSKRYLFIYSSEVARAQHKSAFKTRPFID